VNEIKAKKINVAVPLYHVESLDRLKSRPNFNCSREFLTVLFDWYNGEYDNLAIISEPSRGYVTQYIYVPADKALLYDEVSKIIKDLPRGPDASKVKLADIVITILKYKYGV